MKPFVRATLDHKSFLETRTAFIKHWQENPQELQKIFPNAATMTTKDLELAFDKIAQDEAKHSIWLNDVYQVSRRDMKSPAEGWPEMVWLSIKRIDRQPIHDWRDLQEIKNQLIGPECEALELYPAESRLVDSANQYHLWGIKEPFVSFPIGFTRRFVSNAEVGPTKQRQREGQDS